MTTVFEEYGHTVYSSDLYDRGFGKSGIDFTVTEQKFDNIVTNPPFHSAEAFVHSGLKNTKNKFALLLRLAFLEGGGRQTRIFKENPPSTVWIFSERITFYPKNAIRKGSGTTAYAWFVWDKDDGCSTELRWLPLGYKNS